MGGLFAFLFLLSSTGLVFGLARPQRVPFIGDRTRKRIAKVYGLPTAVFLILAAATGEPSEPPTVQESPSLQESPALVESSPEPATTPEVSPSPELAQFQFPQSTCGDSPSNGGDTWYPVFIDGADIEAVQQSFCADAVSTVRSETGNPTVQVASFTDADRAQTFARAVEGEVGQPSSPEPEPIAEVEPSPLPPPTPRVNPDAPVRAARQGSCDCPYDVDSAGRSCGGRSAYSRPGGSSPVCYERDRQ
ncbi:hypothetical protein C7B61_16475 [filamentous cyanobacterium CCP1]|nr:hypothetical protein C7B76_01950 [filamentous cyanobacterium CCP2]PSB61064.1 hypothetical protein C7B61_16475 [filamentous cyanobacterium CCP1]